MAKYIVEMQMDKQEKFYLFEKTKAEILYIYLLNI